MANRILLFFTLCTLSMISAWNAQASLISHVRAEIISEYSTVKPQQEFWLGIHFQIEPGWHIYWRNPGDSGSPPKVLWNKNNVTGVSLSEIFWPTPRRIPYRSLVNYGYENDVILLTRAKLESSETLSAKVKWLVCKDVCIPEQTDLSLAITVSDHKSASKEATRIHQYVEHIPTPLPISLTPTIQIKDKEILISKIHNSKLALFFPAESDVIKNSATQKFSNGTLTLEKSENFSNTLATLAGVLIVGKNSYEVSFPIPGIHESPNNKQALNENNMTALSALIFAFLGGLILNLMPCVFPVLSLKALNIASQAGEQLRETRRQGWFYTIGVLVAFWILATVLVVFKSGSHQLGWGFQLQSPKFVIFLTFLLFMMALNLLGVFELGHRFANVGSRLAHEEGIVGSFFTGMLATLVATPCTAPFMGTALGYAFTQSNIIAFAVFTALGFGLAFPYLLLAYTPLSQHLPKPGRWMESFKQFLAFPLFATVVWLLWVLSMQVGSDELIGAISMLTLIGFSAWMFGRWKNVLASSIALIIFASIIFVTFFHFSNPVATSNVASTNSTWKTFSPEKVEQDLKEGRPVFVDFTAAWCVTCKVNEKLALEREDVLNEFKKHNVVLYKADWTNADPMITKTLATYGRNGIPLYLFYPPRQTTPKILPQILTSSVIMRELQNLN